MGGDLASIELLLRGPLKGLFTGIHVLPPFPSSGDRGFAPTTYFEVNPRFGSWANVERLAEQHDVVLDLMVNHISRRSPEFEDFVRRGRRSPHADLFITLDKVWPDGDPPIGDIAPIFLRKPDAPFSDVIVKETGERERVWTTFGTRDWSEQIDLDVTSPATRGLITAWLRFFASKGIRIVRLDAVGYVIKKSGTSCFMVEPEIYEFLDWVGSVAESFGLVVLPEIHDAPPTRMKLAAHNYWTYDFELPALVLDAFETGAVSRLCRHLTGSPSRQFTTLDCHDGIPVRPDLEGLLEPVEMSRLADVVQGRGGNVNKIISDTHASGGVAVHQLNATYYDALGADDDRYLLARAIQLFAPGIPQIYYVGLLAGRNDHEAVRLSGDGRAINRHNFSWGEIEARLATPLVRRILDLVKLRNEHPAFGGELEVTSRGSTITMMWARGDDQCQLVGDVASGSATIEEFSAGKMTRSVAA
ncbi:MAG: sucrose phosphorylase [Chloroflexi bacterium]|nr:sucrose phosphorylase [Chloroflexota bacterium]